MGGELYKRFFFHYIALRDGGTIKEYVPVSTYCIIVLLLCFVILFLLKKNNIFLIDKLKNYRRKNNETKDYYFLESLQKEQYFIRTA